MDKTDRFVSDGNITRFVDRLRIETDPHRQVTLKQLLIEEENRFGATEERLRMVERQLTEGAAHIVRLTRAVAQMESDGEDRARAERNLQISITIQELFEDFRSAIYAQHERRPGAL